MTVVASLFVSASRFSGCFCRRRGRLALLLRRGRCRLRSFRCGRCGLAVRLWLRCRRRRRFSLRRLLFLWWSSCLGGTWSLSFRLWSSAGASAVEHGHRFIHLNGVAFVKQNLRQGSGRRRRDFRIDFVRRDFKQRLISLDAIANLLQPLGYCSFRNGFTHLRHYHFCCHNCSNSNYLSTMTFFLLPFTLAPLLFALNCPLTVPSFRRL